jgi:hypothetical protein
VSRDGGEAFARERRVRRREGKHCNTEAKHGRMTGVAGLSEDEEPL